MLYEVIIDAGEKANKCTIAPLYYRPDFRLRRVTGGGGSLGTLSSDVLLHHEGECLTTIRASMMAQVQAIACVDCIWSRLGSLLRRIDGDLPKLARIPTGFVTAYPRSSARNADPEGGLATIEAIFVAAALLGNWDLTLLSEYYFGRQFIELNRSRLLDLGVRQASCEDEIPVLSDRPRHAWQRRRNRGRLPKQTMVVARPS